MELYDAKVRLNGKIQNEVPKTSITAAELLVLRAIHGDDAVVDLKIAGDEPKSHDDERDRLGRLYGDKVVRELFGASHQELPRRLPGFAATAAPAQVEADKSAVKSLLDD